MTRLKTVKKPSCFFVLLFFCINAFAQEKATPPPAKISLPSDTAKVVPDKSAKMEAKKPEIELPDVMITGKDQQLRTAGEKELLLPQSPTLVVPRSPYEAVSRWTQTDSTKPQAQLTLPKDKLSWLSLQAGGYTTILADAGYWQKSQNGSYRLSGWLDRSNGEFKNSAYSQGGLSGTGQIKLSPSVKAVGQAEYALYSRGLYRTEPAKMSRRAHAGNLSGSLEYTIDELSEATFAFGIGGAVLRSDTSQVELQKSGDFWYTLKGDVTTRWAGIQWTFSGDFLRESFDYEDTTNVRSSLANLVGEASIPVSKKVIGVLGLSYQAAVTDTLAGKNRISPYGKLYFMPSRFLGLSAQVETGYRLTTFTQWWQRNPYVAHQVPLTPEETTLRLRTECEVNLSSGVKLSGSYQRLWMESAFYWQRNDSLNTIELYPLADPRFTEIALGIEANLSDRLRLDASYITYANKVAITEQLELQERIPYIPDFRIPVRSYLSFYKDLELAIFANIYGKRPAALNLTKRLPSFALVDVSLSKKIGDNVTLLGTVRNIFDTGYVLWEEFSETGVYVMIGARAKF